MKIAFQGMIFSICALLNTIVHAAPTWTITPLTTTTVSVSSNMTATVSYLVTNQSKKSHTLSLSPVPGITQTTLGTHTCGTVFTLPGKGTSCTLSLLVDGNQVMTGSANGPVICEQGHNQQCYRPAAADVLNINRDTRAQYAYIVNLTNTLAICPLTNNGASFGTCITAVDGSFNAPLSIAFNPKANQAYITNYFGGTVSICPLKNDGSLDTCVATTAGNSIPATPDTIVVNSTSTFAYISGALSNTIAICPLNNDGSLNNCTTSNGNGTFNGATGLALSANNAVLYVANALANNISICPVNPDGSLSTCTVSSGNGTINEPKGISLDARNHLAYIANQSTVPVTVSVCPLNSNGTFGNLCTLSAGDATFDFSAGWSENLFMSSTKNYAYIPNNGNNTVSICSIASNGSLEVCSVATGNAAFSTPVAVMIN
jgi:6-phosphogluconolactonase (cycloisomerase 2 family)